MMKTKAVIYDAKDSIRVGEVTLAECGPKQLVAETLYTFGQASKFWRPTANGKKP